VLLDAARRFRSPKAPLRPLTLYTMLILGYCAGLRIGEVVGLAVKDIDLNAGAIEVRDTSPPGRCWPRFRKDLKRKN
jgi:integrase